MAVSKKTSLTLKTREAAKSYIYAYARFVAWDNHDDMDESDRWAHTFNVLVDDRIPLEDYIKQNMPEEIEKAKEAAKAECSQDEDYWEGAFDGYDEEFA